MHNYYQNLYMRKLNLILDLLIRFLNQARWPQAGTSGFLKLHLCGRLYAFMYVHVCVPAPEAIKS